MWKERADRKTIMRTLAEHNNFHVARAKQVRKPKWEANGAHKKFL
jgi:hypothetical protein